MGKHSKGFAWQSSWVSCVSLGGAGQGRTWGGDGTGASLGLGGQAGRLGQGRDLAWRQAWGSAQRWCPGQQRPCRAPPCPASGAC